MKASLFILSAYFLFTGSVQAEWVDGEFKWDQPINSRSDNSRRSQDVVQDPIQQIQPVPNPMFVDRLPRRTVDDNGNVHLYKNKAWE